VFEMSKFAAAVIIVLTVAFWAPAQSKKSVEIARIDALVRLIDRFEAREPKKLIFADTANFDDRKAAWKVFETEKALNKFREETETYTIAFNWLRNGKLVASNFTLFSPSGDWTKYVFHYFRSDRTVAMVRSELRTFFGEFIVKEDKYFDRRGRLLRKQIGYFDLTSGKPKKPTKEMQDDNPSLFKVDYYLNVNKLPFAKLIYQ
jgi:hypothetical protein